MRGLLKAALACAAAVLCGAICYRWLGTPFWNVNGARLMPSLALAHGIDYYVRLPPGGPLYSSLYGPVGAIVYLPATLFATPNSAVLAGAAITVMLCFGTAAVLHFTPGARGAADVAAFLAAGFLMCFLDPLKYSCFNIHADGPGLALAGLACAALYGGGEPRLAVSAACAVLAVFAKQTFLPAPFALLIYVLARDGGRRARHYLAWLAGAGAVAGAAALWTIGFRDLWHCLIWLPAHHPWNSGSRFVSWTQAARELIRLTMPVPVLLLAGAVYAGLEGGWRGWARRRCAPVLLVGVALAPLSVLGRAKTGGDINSLSFAAFFLACGLTVMLADVCRQADSAGARRVAIAVLAGILAPLALFEAPLSFAIPQAAAQLPRTEQSVALRYLERHPGAAYFPWLPLPHYFAEHQFRHYGFGIVDRLLAGEPVTMAEFRAYIPPDPRVIAFGKDGTPEAFGIDLMRYLPEYRDRVNDPDLPGWLVFARSSR